MVLEQSLADGLPLATEEVARDRVASDEELVRVILAARQIGRAYGGIVELLDGAMAGNLWEIGRHGRP
jgi:hypothetical protein